MCLVKSSIFKAHYSKPLVADEDIVVYKALDHRDAFTGKKTLRTPYQFYPISFKDGKCIMDGYLECTLNKSVSFGFHSYADEKEADAKCKLFQESEMTKHWAIIPKGGRYFLGEDRDVVSDKLIIFETKEDFMQYMLMDLKAKL